MPLAASRLRLTVAVAFLALASFQLERAAEAQTPLTPIASPSPVPQATATPKAFTVHGNVRAFWFTRQNASGFPSTANQLNQQSINFGATLGANYRVGNSGFSLGATYFYANPFNGCADPRSTSVKCTTLSGNAALMSPNHLNPDTSLPGYSLSGFLETYLQYSKNGLFARIGDQIINTPWANAGDVRLKPASFEGADVSYQINPHYNVELMDMIRFQPRTTSDFVQSNLLTGAPAELPHGGGPPLASGANTGGFQYARVGYTSKNFVSNLHYYHFLDLANFAWLDGKYTFSHQPLKSWLAIQAGDEKNTGASIVGKINTQVYGAQVGVNVSKNLVFTAAADVLPRHIENLPPGVNCAAATGQIVPMQTFPNPSAGFFVGSGVPQCIANPNGTSSVEYGGIASPYTDAYGNDPLFTSSLTQGMVDRRAPGSSEKLALTYTSTNKRLVLMVSRAYYDYGFTGFPDQTAETDGDASYYFSPVTPGPYHGLRVRYRYGVRTDDHSSALNVPAGTVGPFFGQLPYFVYTRTQLEYDF